MNHQIVVQQRQQQLLIRSTELRYQLRGSLDSLQGPASVLDNTLKGLSWLRNNPLWPLAGLVALLVLKPRRTLAWGSSLVWLWKVTRPVHHWRERLRKLTSR